MFPQPGRQGKGHLPLHLVCGAQTLSKNSVEVCRQLLLAHKQGFAVTDKTGKLPLHILCAGMLQARAHTPKT
ncbi:hypothetical protein T484DRAFT_1790854 [Baffinella frigidus]|nr:hypothetical protein T484DRAFT_1790854 [Cryptophyta sp. CCMP2293]